MRTFGTRNPELSEILSVDIGLTGSRRADRKSMAERGFKLIASILPVELPGFSPPSAEYRNRSGRKSDKGLTLLEIQAIVSTSIMTHNARVAVDRDGALVSAPLALERSDDPK